MLTATRRFELALALGKLKTAHKIAGVLDSEAKWKQLAEAATRLSLFDLAEECLAKARDFSGQLLLYSCVSRPCYSWRRAVR